jgi:beta-lactam-binding protein with PASTA domain
MTTCPSCGRELEPGRDFCACGEYVRWEPTGYLPAITPEQAAAARREADGASPPPAGAPADAPLRMASEGAASVTLRLPDEAAGPASGDPVAVGVVPGGSATVVALIRNQSGIVDNYDLDVRGIPREWWSARPETVYLVPYGSAGTYEQEVELELHPPRTPEAESRTWELEVVAISRAAQGPAAAAPLLLGILPYEQVEVKPTPDRRSGRRKARYDVAVRNRANAALDVVLDARDADGECRTSFAQRTLTIKPGETVTTTLEVRPPRQRLIGRPLERRIEVSAATGDEAERLLAEPEAPTGGSGGRGLPKVPGMRGPRLSRPDLAIGPDGVKLRGPRVSGPSMGQVHVGSRMPQMDLRKLQARANPGTPPPLAPTQVIFRQRSWLPWWLAIVVPLLLVLLLLLWLLWPRTTHVPKVTGSGSVFAAQQRLEAKDLKLDPGVQKVVRAGVRPGTVVGQAPKPGKKVDKGSSVAIQIAVGTSSVKVPSLAGKTLSQAEQALRGVQLVIGRTSVTPPDPKAKIASQIPAAGELVRAGSPVDLYYGKAGRPGGGAGGASAGGGGGGGDVTVPAIDPKDLQGYAAKVSDEGLVPQPVQQFSSEPKGTVFATEPAAGSEVEGGSTVRVLVSAGFPQLAIDDDRDVLRIDGATGKRLGRIARTEAAEKDPSWSADGTAVAYEQGGRIMLATLGEPEQPAVPITPEGEDYADPSFAPVPQPNVLAVARLNADGDRNDTDLCLGLVTSEGVRPQCIVDRSTGVGDARWAPDGKTIYVAAVNKAREFGIVRYRSQVPFSARASDWRGGEFVTPTDRGGTGVRDLAISPDGKRIAVVSNLDSGEFRLAIAKADDLRLEDARRLPVQACKVIWRPDGKEVVIVQAGALCTQPTGQLFRIEVDRSPEAVPLAASGDNPSFQPLVGG